VLRRMNIWKEDGLGGQRKRPWSAKAFLESD
jgi:hypothetical protein